MGSGLSAYPPTTDHAYSLLFRHAYASLTPNAFNVIASFSALELLGPRVTLGFHLTCSLSVDSKESGIHSNNFERQAIVYMSHDIFRAVDILIRRVRTLNGQDRGNARIDERDVVAAKVIPGLFDPKRCVYVTDIY